MDEVPANRGREQQPPSPGRVPPWVWVVLFVLLALLTGAVSGFVRSDASPGDIWLIAAAGLLVGVGIGAVSGWLLRRRLGWRQSAWAARRRRLSWRQRLRVGWAFERGRAADDPEVARATAERSEYALRTMAHIGGWHLWAARITAVLFGLLLVLLVVTDLVRGEPIPWHTAAVLALLAATGLLQRPLWAWATRRTERTLALNREVATRAYGPDDGTAGS